MSEAGKEDHQVLIDGYRRREALHSLGADRIWVSARERSVDEALMLCLARAPDCAWEEVEEVALIEELNRRHSLPAIAQRLGWDLCWVSRRLNLIKALPEDLLEQVRAGRISCWAAIRILVLLARANPEHARRLIVTADLILYRNGRFEAVAGKQAPLPARGKRRAASRDSMRSFMR